MAQFATQSIYRIGNARIVDAVAGAHERGARAKRPTSSSVFRGRLRRAIAARLAYSRKRRKTAPTSAPSGRSSSG